MAVLGQAALTGQHFCGHVGGSFDDVPAPDFAPDYQVDALGVLVPHAGYDGSIFSLEREISNLGRRANLNLVMGTVVTALRLSLLAYFVLYANQLSAPDDRLDIAIYFGTRLTLVLFIEVFAYFFLRLYRYCLFEIKYFQNEVTNARFKIVALESCLHDGSKQMIDMLCMELVKTERNFILKKGETIASP